MYTVYVLKDDSGNVYKGYTSNIDRRLFEHRSGHTQTTRRMTNIQLVYKEEYSDRVEARKRELYFKTAAGRRFLKSKMV